MLALAGKLSLHGYDACMVYWNEGAPWEISGKSFRKTSVSPVCVFLLSRYSVKRFLGQVIWHL